MAPTAQARDPGKLLASVRSAAIEECGLLLNAPEGFMITCNTGRVDPLKLQFCAACAGDAERWLFAILHNASHAWRADIDYDARCAWAVHGCKKQLREAPPPLNKLDEASESSLMRQGKAGRTLQT